MKLIFGVILILFSVIVVGGSFGPIITQELSYRVNTVSSPTEIKVVEPLDTDFGIVIPKINANSRIIQDVDPNIESIYQEALTKGVAHAKGSSLPGGKGNIFLFSHSSSDFLSATKYNSIFYLLSKLESGDPIKLYHKQTEFNYLVREKKVVEADDISYLQIEDTGESLTLMTCWPPGTSLKRLIIQADRIR